jgi:hypothetical protein
MRYAQAIILALETAAKAISGSKMNLYERVERAGLDRSEHLLKGCRRFRRHYDNQDKFCVQRVLQHY